METFVVPLLYGLYLSIPGWLRSTLMLAVELAAFLFGLRIAFPTAFHDPAHKPDSRQPRRRLAAGVALLTILLLFTTQVQPWRVVPLRLWCAVRWPDSTANAVWQGSNGKPLLQRPMRDAANISKIKTGECIQAVGRDTAGKWFAVQRDGVIGWAELWETDVEWLVKPARLPIIEP